MKVNKKLESDFKKCMKNIYLNISDIIKDYNTDDANIFMNMLISYITEPFIFANDRKLMLVENKEKAIKQIKEYIYSLECNLINQLEHKHLDAEFQKGL